MILKSLAPLFSLSDFSLKGRASAMHYRTMVGRINLWALLFTLLCLGVLHLTNFPLAEFIRSVIADDTPTLDGIITTMRTSEIAIFVIIAATMVYLFILSVGAMIMRLHDFNRSGWWVAPLLIVPAMVDSFIVDGLGLTRVSWLVMTVALLMLYKSGDFGKNSYGYSEPDNFSLPLQLISFIPVIFILVDLVLTFIL